jgi:hypothetical protein
MRIIAALILCSSFTFAACPDGYPTISEEYKGAVMVVVGRVIAHGATPAEGDFYDGDIYTVIPTRVLKGAPGSKFDLFSENSSGRFPMELNREYLLFVYGDHGRLMVDYCGNSDMLPRAKNTLAQTIAVATHEADSQAALKSLLRANPAVHWTASSAEIADFDCDGKTDTAMLGSKKGRVVIGVVWASKKPPQVFTFPIGTQTQDGFSEQPKRIETLPLDCKGAQGRDLPGCKTIPACKALVIRDDDTDPFNFYWDSSHATLRWWRE